MLAVNLIGNKLICDDRECFEVDQLLAQIFDVAGSNHLRPFKQTGIVKWNETNSVESTKDVFVIESWMPARDFIFNKDVQDDVINRVKKLIR